MTSSNGFRKQKRTRLTLGQKLEAAWMVQSGACTAYVMSEFNVSRRFVTNLKSDAKQLIEEAEKLSTSLDIKTARPAKLPGIDKAVMDFSAKMPVTQAVIMQRGLIERERLLRDDQLDPDERLKVERFGASIGWADKFVKRHGLNSVIFIEQSNFLLSHTERLLPLGRDSY